MEHRRVTKFDAASRQIIEAVLLYFEERDPIAIHAIIASDHQILTDIEKQKNVESIVKNTTALKATEVQAFLKTVNYPYNFLKHADRDPDASIDVDPLLTLTVDFIMDSFVMLQRLAGSIPIEVKIFWAWFLSIHHEQFEDLPKDGIARLQTQGLGEWPLLKVLAFLNFSRIAEDASA